MKIVKKRLIVWAVVIIIVLMIPLLTMQFTDEISWDLFDFVIMGTVLFGIGSAYELVARKSKRTIYRAAFGQDFSGLSFYSGLMALLG